MDKMGWEFVFDGLVVWVFFLEDKSHFTGSNFQEISSEEIFQHLTVQH